MGRFRDFLQHLHRFPCVAILTTRGIFISYFFGRFRWQVGRPICVRGRGQVRVRSRLFPNSGFGRFFRHSTTAQRDCRHVARVYRFLFTFIRKFRFGRLHRTYVIPILLCRGVEGGADRLAAVHRRHVNREARRTGATNAVGRASVVVNGRSPRDLNYNGMGEVCFDTKDTVCTCKVCLIRRFLRSFVVS